LPSTIFSGIPGITLGKGIALAFAGEFEGDVEKFNFAGSVGVTCDLIILKLVFSPCAIA
jgi:hypothetical protein